MFVRVVVLGVRVQTGQYLVSTLPLVFPFRIRTGLPRWLLGPLGQRVVFLGRVLVVSGVDHVNFYLGPPLEGEFGVGGRGV